ncbi:anti-sigma E factor [Vibrio cidicii]|jgi:sigma-E factor negative regulatory protein RseA|uniref:Anti-sigma-E factor RseA n=2 Tax=Vibrio TaxID=662 RepID=A0A151JHL6_9VIBR|nr:sigma-E factor negative regulatory protein [Vibrio cidicii]EJN6829193.1 sigma-E factor negative regulatory protein [Vibrio cidicii]ELV8626036.1 sigma-E factor negative regulatory protein [Vibrio cidicii]KYN25271.1 anti-sigma E factor [Vibrio cidicii]KYN87732.1 anti-sigma E factor [Vibrio cidicii]MBG0757858.1 anti-sigma E factor [Vibrio cidicii]
MADKEKLSALMDGETVDLALLREIEQDQDSLDSWRHYHLIGDVMRGEGPSQPQWNIAESVALALEDEPVHSAHQQRIVELSQVPRESQPTPREAKKQLPAWLSQFGQVAIAACVSLAVIIGVQQYGGGDSSVPQAEQLPVLQTIPFAGSAEPVSLTRESVEKSMSDASLQEQRKRVHAMLRDYELQLRLNSDSSMLEDEQLKSEIE